MQSSGIPTKFPLVWAYAAGTAYIRTVPTASQVSVTPGAASFTDGFPPLNATPVAAGGVPPFMQDFNGILKALTAWSQWHQAGGPIAYDASFATTVGGYPLGASLSAAQTGGRWTSLIDGNTSNPDAGGANWLAARIRLSVNLNLYVSTTGSDINSGLTVATAFATLQKAYNVIQNGYDLNGHIVTVNVGGGTYPLGLTAANGMVVGQSGPGSIIFNGPGVTLNVPGGASCFLAQNGAQFTVSGGFILQGSGSGSNGLAAQGSGSMIVASSFFCGSMPNGTHIQATGGGAIQATSYSINGTAQYHLLSSGAGANVTINGTIIVTGTPPFAIFAVSQFLGFINVQNSTFSGAATGVKYTANVLAVVDTGGSGNPNLLPGNVGGTTASGGVYV